MNLFHSARLKLTLWYLLIIMFISAVFSLIIYRSVTAELERRFGFVEQRMHQQMMRYHFQAPPKLTFVSEHLIAAKKRVLLILLYANGMILGVAGGASYFLSGRTLKPIEESMEEQERFVSDASHELRTPITALKTSIEVALRNKRLTAKEAKEVLKESLEEVDSLEMLTSSLLSLARTSKPEDYSIFELTDLREVVESALKKVKAMAKNKNLKIERNIESVVLTGDREGLEKLAVILLDNAIKYTPRGGKIWVEVGQEHKNAVLKVSDSGVGIAEKNLPHIFDRFYRVEPSRSKSKTPGYGLGLSIAKKIVERHKGKIGVKSQVGKGTTFTVRLPLKLA